MEGRAAFGAYETWYRVTGELGGEKAPVVILHGGPGVAHNYVDAYKLLARRDRAVIHYDQLGCGNSTLLPEKGADFWTPGLFIDELENLVDHLGIRTGFHVLGQSWGGMLGAEYAVTRPQGLKSLTIANSPASMKLWVEEANRLRADLPADVQETLTRHEQARHDKRCGVPGGDDGVLRAACLPGRAFPVRSHGKFRPGRAQSGRL